MKKIYITGVSGTGKTTVAKELEKHGFYTISIDEVENLCSWVHQVTGEKHGGKYTELTLEFVDEHDWICDIEYLNKLLDKNLDIAFVLGMAGNQDEFLHIFDKIILLQCSPETFCKRIENRTDNNFGKDKKIQQQILARYEAYAEKMMTKGAISIDTEKPIDDVVSEVISQVAQGDI
jgi:thymidylate kinase